jgi:predicted RNase H-like HicB family nuclease
MEYPVIVERNNGIFKARIPNLPDLSAEGSTSDEAVLNVQYAARNYLARVEMRMIQVPTPEIQLHKYSTARDWIEASEAFIGDEDAIREHFAEIEAERQRQREEAQRQDDE